MNEQELNWFMNYIIKITPQHNYKAIIIGMPKKIMNKKYCTYTFRGSIGGFRIYNKTIEPYIDVDILAN